MARTQVGIVGAGPAGLMLSHLLHLQGIDSVVLESRSRDYVERRIRAGVLEQGVVDLLNATGLGERLNREGLVHHGVELRFDGAGHRLDLFDLTGGRAVTVYGQTQVVKDLIRARLAASGEIRFEAEVQGVHDLDGERARIVYRQDDETWELQCDYIAGCDGSHGVCRAALPAGLVRGYERRYPFGWLGILADVAPSSDELIYANHERGFALHSMRSPRISRLYIQCAPDENLDNWPDERIWEELRLRLATRDGFVLRDGPVLEKSITPMRSLVAEPMGFGRLFLAGDAAHIVPPTGAKGLNLAINDVRVLAGALIGFYRENRRDLLAAYSDTCLQRVWKVAHFSWWMTSMLHRFEEDDAFGRRLQLAQLDYVCSSRAAAASLAENYTGLPVV